MMMRSPGRAFSEALSVAFVLLLPLAEVVLAVALLAGVFFADDVFLVLVPLAVVLLAGTACLPTASASLSLLLRLEMRASKPASPRPDITGSHSRLAAVTSIDGSMLPLPVAVGLKRKAVRFAQDVELVLLSPVLSSLLVFDYAVEGHRLHSTTSKLFAMSSNRESYSSFCSSGTRKTSLYSWPP
jgi:hypothetical protein